MFSAEGWRLRYWNLDTGKMIQELKYWERALSGAFTPDGRHAVWADWFGILHLYRLLDIPELPVVPQRRSPNTKKRSGKADDAASQTNRSKAPQGPGKVPAAIAEHKEAVPFKPDDATDHNNRGKALRADGKLAEAIVEYETAIRLKPEFPDAHTGLGIALAAQNKLEDAIAEYKTSIRLDPPPPLPTTVSDSPCAVKGNLKMGSPSSRSQSGSSLTMPVLLTTWPGRWRYRKAPAAGLRRSTEACPQSCRACAGLVQPEHAHARRVSNGALGRVAGR